MFYNLLVDLFFILIGVILIIIYFKKYDKNEEKIKKGIKFLIIGVIFVTWFTIVFIDGFVTNMDGCCICYEYIGSNGYSPQVCCNCAWPFSYK